MADHIDKTVESFWDSIDEEGATKADQEVVDEIVTVPRTDRAPFKWRDSDSSELCGAVPAPFKKEETRDRLNYIRQEWEPIGAMNRRASNHIFHACKGVPLLQFDALADDDQKLVLDQRYGEVSDSMFRKHRALLHRQSETARRQIESLRSRVTSGMRIPSDCELQMDEQVAAGEIYDWLLYQLQFDSMKWLLFPRTYNRAKIMTELIIRLFYETHFVATIITAEQLQRWIKANSRAWRMVLEKHVVFISIKTEMPRLFWDELFEEAQMLTNSGRSVIFVSDLEPREAIADELIPEYHTIGIPQNTTFLSSSKIDRDSFEFMFKVPARTESQQDDGSATTGTNE